jgi:hypothetical protein
MEVNLIRFKVKNICIHHSDMFIEFESEKDCKEYLYMDLLSQGAEEDLIFDIPFLESPDGNCFIRAENGVVYRWQSSN